MAFGEIQQKQKTQQVIYGEVPNVLKMSKKYCISAEGGTALQKAQMEMIIVLLTRMW